MKKEEILHTEAKIQQDCVIWYRNGFCLATMDVRCLIFSVPNEGDPFLTQIGAMPGVSDLIAIHRNTRTERPRLAFIEIKTINGRQSPKQRAFQQIVEDMGFEYHIVRNLQAWKSIVSTWITTK